MTLVSRAAQVRMCAAQVRVCATQYVCMCVWVYIWQGRKQVPWQNSWGITTRTIGVS